MEVKEMLNDIDNDLNLLRLRLENEMHEAYIFKRFQEVRNIAITLDDLCTICIKFINLMEKLTNEE